MEKILLVNVNWLGDVLFSTPLIRAIRQRFPGAHIACVIVPRVRAILELNPNINEIIIYDEDGAHKGPLGKLRFILDLRSKKFGTALILHRSLTRALLVFLAGIPKRIGYRTKKRSFLLTSAIDLPGEELHRVDWFLKLGEALAITRPARDYEFFISKKDREAARAFLAKEGVKDFDVLIALNPGGNWDPKRWPAENFAKLADSLVEKIDAKFIITGAKKDLALADNIASMMKQRPVIACGRFTLKESAAILERANLVIANDSGPMHMAVAVGAKTVALFGPTSPEITGPIGKGSFTVLQKATGCVIPCYNLACGDYRCMKALTVDYVLTEALKLLKR
ncbi:MAG: lipopolysaccharide heptosyltransferase II [Candidatus Omnitrophica bacterium]|nr:lipopolysaccharide heptosyltransferase II [Candidatus Omnitrophota bacterium]